MLRDILLLTMMSLALLLTVVRGFTLVRSSLLLAVVSCLALVRNLGLPSTVRWWILLTLARCVGLYLFTLNNGLSLVRILGLLTVMCECLLILVRHFA